MKNSTPSPSLYQSRFETAENGNIELTITIPWSVVSQRYDQTLKSLAEKITVKGFREGKAPLEMVAKQLGKQHVYEKMIPDLLTDAYLESVKNHKLRPVVNPKFQLTKTSENEDWELKATTAQLPDVNLNNYESAVKKELAPKKIWVPGKENEEEQENPEDQEKKLSNVFQALLKTVSFQVPQIIIDEEVTRLLSRLIDQTAKLGLTVEQYLDSIGKTSQELRKEYAKQAEEAVRLELILAAIADKEKITVEDKEIEEMIEASGDESVKKQLRSDNQRAYLHQLLRKRKVIDKLSSL